MTHLERLALTLAIIFVSLGCGYLVRRASSAGKISASRQNLDVLRKRLQTVAVFSLLPFSAMLSMWGLPQPRTSLLALPLLGLVSYIWGGVLALLAARWLKLNRAQTGSIYCCGTFTNIGAVGGLVCLLFLGENSIALVALYRLLEEVYYFSVSFPIARWHSPENQGRQTISFRSFRPDPVLLVIICALSLGIALNLLRVPRPEFCGPLASGAMLAATIFFLFSIGLSLRLSSLAGCWKPSMAVCAIKFFGVPLVVILLAMGMGYGSFDDGLALKVAAVLSSMPVAMTALVPPTLFGLDVDLANACWIYSTLGLIIVLPVLLLLLPAL